MSVFRELLAAAAGIYKAAYTTVFLKLKNNFKKNEKSA